MKKIIYLILFSLTLYPLSSILFSQSVLAEAVSKVYFKGPNAPVGPGGDLVLEVLLDTKDSLNALDLEISYPADKLKFSAADNSGSIVDIWQSPPRLLSNGHIGFSGGMLKAWNGPNGLLVKLSFKVLARGEATISFVKSNLYIADGEATPAVVDAPSLSLVIEEDGEVISTSITPFQSTPADIVIEKELENFKTGMQLKKIVPISIIVLVVLISILVYNRRRKTQE